MAYCSECSASVPDDVEVCPTCGASLESTEVLEIETPEPPELDLERLQATLSASLSPTYEVLRPLGKGGMGAIFLAKEPALKRLVAVKVLAPQLAADANARARFEREARAAAAISHPNVVRVFAVGQTKRTKLPYIIMQYVDGPNLEEWRLRRRRLSEREARRIIGEVAAALAAAHERELVHRDVKPSNVLLESESGRAFVADFGVSAALSSAGEETRLTRTGAVIGTPTYMSPEQSASGPLTPTSDVYSLGVLAYELLTGELPFAANSAMGWAAAHLRDTPTPMAERRPEISPAIAQMVDRCLAKAPDDRPAAEEIARGMLPSLETEIDWPPPGLQWFLGRGRVVSRWALISAAGAAIAVTASAFVPEVLLASAGWLHRFAIAGDLSGTAQQVDNSLSNVEVLAMFVWQIALTVGLVTYGVSGLAFLSTGSRTIDRILRQRRMGWKISTLLDLMVDYDCRSGLILAGSGDFASFNESRRRSILRARRGANATAIAGGVWVITAFAMRVLLLILGITGPGTTNTVLGTSDVALILAPGLLLFACGFGFRIWERHILGELARQHSYDADPEDVSRWYESLPAEDARPASSIGWGKDRALVWSIRLARLAVFLIVPVCVCALALGTVATLTAGRFSGRFGPGAAELLATLEDIDREDPIGEARSVWGQYLPRRHSVTDGAANEWMQRLRLNVRHPDAPPAYGLPLAEFFEWNAAERRTETETAFERALAGEIPADTIRLLEYLASHPRTMLLRGLASASRFGSWDVEGLPASAETSRASRSTETAVAEAMRANTLAAVYEACQGRVDSAVLRLGENAAIGEQLLHSPSLAANRAAMVLISNHALYPLAALQRTLGNIERAVELDRAAEQLRLPRRFGNAAGLATNPLDLDQFLAAVSNTRVPPGYRVAWLRQGWAGLCAHPREILLGPDYERRARMSAVVGSMSDIPQVREHAEFFESIWRWRVTTLRAGAPIAEEEVQLREKLLWGPVLRVMACAYPDNPN